MTPKFDTKRLDKLRTERDELTRKRAALTKRIKTTVKSAIAANLTYAEIGRHLGMTGERVRQIAEGEEVQSSRARTVLVRSVPTQRAGGE